jgi:hypothetical protein
MLIGELLSIGGGAVGGYWLWGHGHPVWAVAAWIFAAGMVVSIVSTIVTEERSFKELAGSLAVGLLGAAYLAALGGFCWWLWQSGNSGWAVLAGIFGLWGVPLGLAMILNRIRGE